jgi:nitrate reductase delta subunit
VRVGAKWVPSGAERDQAAVVLRVASVLLDYPGPTGDADIASCVDALREAPSAPGHAALLRFLGWWVGLSLAEREQYYVALFDLDGSVTLFLSEGRPGTSRERAVALLEPPHGAASAAPRRDELPDYLPLLLQVAAQLPAARPALTAERPAMETLAAALEWRGSPFAEVVAAVLAVTPFPPRGLP